MSADLQKDSLSKENKKNTLEENISTIGDFVYSQDLTTTELSLNKAIGHIIASLAIGPIRLITKVASNILLLPYDLLKQYIEHVLFIITSLIFISLIHATFSGRINLLLITILFYPIPLFILYKLTQKKKPIYKKKSISVDFQPLEEECNKIYEELDKIIMEENI